MLAAAATRRTRGRPGSGATALRRLTGAGNLMEAEMIAAFLAEEGIRVLIRRTPASTCRSSSSPARVSCSCRGDELERAQDLVESHFGLN